MRLIDPELLRTFVAFAQSGSLSRAAEIVGRSPSAITAQMQRLEDTIGEPLLLATGRGRALTPAGEDLVVEAQRILEVNRQAWLNLKGVRADGRISIGATQDFTESALHGPLREFAVSHNRVRLELRVGRSFELIKAFDDGLIDVFIGMRLQTEADEIGIVREPMLWLGTDQGLAVSTDELPLALLDPPCGFRSAALSVLESAKRPFRINATSGSLSGLKAAVLSGLALTLRTERWCEGSVVDVSESLHLPAVPSAVFSIRLRQEAEPAAKELAELLCFALDAHTSN